MKEYLRNKGFEVLHDVANQGICPLDIFQTMMQACLISANELSKLKEMMEFCSRNDLIQHIDQFDKNCGVLRNGKVCLCFNALAFSRFATVSSSSCRTFMSNVAPIL
jgi:hypothetical protein